MLAQHQEVHAAIWYSRIESGLALLVSFLINLAVVLAFWRHFYRVECASMEGGPFVCVGADALGEGDVLSLTRIPNPYP